MNVEKENNSIINKKINGEDPQAEKLFISAEFYKKNYKIILKPLRVYLKNKIHPNYLSCDMLKLLLIIFLNKKKCPNLYDLFFKNGLIVIGSENKFILNFTINSLREANISDLWTRFLIQYHSNKDVCFKRFVDNKELIFFNTEISLIIIDFFKELENPKFKRIQTIDDISQFYTLKRFLTEYKNEKSKLIDLYKLNKRKIDEIFNTKTEEEFMDHLNKVDFNIDKLKISEESELIIPSHTIYMENLQSLLYLVDGFEFSLLRSPLIKSFNFSSNTPQNIITRTKIRIYQKEFLTQNQYEYIVSKLFFLCPSCQEKVIIDPNELLSNVSHLCGFSTNVKTKINTKYIKPETQTAIVLYKCAICTNYDSVIKNKVKENWVDDYYIYSFKEDILPGFYIGEIVKFNEPFNILKKDSCAINYLLLGFQREEIKYLEDKIIKNDLEIKKIIDDKNTSAKFKTQYLHLNEIIYGVKKLPQHKIWNILFSIRQYYKNRFNVEINDNGLLLQLMCLISGIARFCFNENKIAISVMGVGSVSKTFPSNMILCMLDLNLKYISDSTRVSTPALTGGVNPSANINGQTIRKFEKGLISTRGFLILDEAQTVFLKPEIQAVIKSLPQSEYLVSVVGGGKVNYSSTPIFLSNFNEFMKKYEQEVINAYIVKYKFINKNENDRFFKTNLDIINYVSKINLYQNIEYYMETLEDKILANVIYSVRKNLENERIDWKTGSQIEATNRLLLDVVIHRKKNQMEIEVDEGLLKRENFDEIDLMENYPVQQVNEELIKYIYEAEDFKNIDWINLKDKSNNSSARSTQLEELEESICIFLTTEKLGINISKYFTENVDHFDSKIKSLVIKVIKLLQLVDDINSTELSENTKKLANNLLLKCKRGLIQEEYNLDINPMEIKSYPDLNVDFLTDLEDTKIEIYYEEKKKEELRKLEKEMEEKYNAEIDKDNSLLEFSVDLRCGSHRNEDQLSVDLEKDKEYDLKTICVKLGCFSNSEEEQKEFIKRLKSSGKIYEPKSGVYKSNY